MTCALCLEPMLPWEDVRGTVHRECGLRAVVGSIEHLTMGPHTVGACHEIDRGLSYRANARLVDTWISEHGVEAALGHG